MGLVLCVTEPYSPRSAQAHLARVQELLSAPSPQDALREGRSPSVLNTLLHTAGKRKMLCVSTIKSYNLEVLNTSSYLLMHAFKLCVIVSVLAK